MDDIAQVLKEYADQDAATWEVNRNHLVTRVKAYTATSFADRDAAYAAASQLVDRVLALGYKLQANAEIGAASDDLPSEAGGWAGSAEPWQGKIAIVVVPE